MEKEGQFPQYRWKIESHSEDPYVKYLFSSFMFITAESAITFFHGLNRGQKIGRNSTRGNNGVARAKPRMNSIGWASRALICTLSIFSFCCQVCSLLPFKICWCFADRAKLSQHYFLFIPPPKSQLLKG